MPDNDGMTQATPWALRSRVVLSPSEQAAVRSWTDEEWLRLLRELPPEGDIGHAIATVNQWRATVPATEAVEWLGQLLPDRSEGDFGPGGEELAANILDAMTVQGWAIVRTAQP